MSRSLGSPSGQFSPGMSRSALSPSDKRPVAVISAADYSEIAKASRERALAEQEEKLRLIATSAVRAEQEKLRHWARQSVPYWLKHIPQALANALRACMRLGKDLSGIASPAGQDGELRLLPERGGLVFRYARNRGGDAVSFVDPTHFPGVLEESFLWCYRPIRDGELFSYCAPGMAGQTTERLTAFRFLDIAAASVGLPSVSETWAATFPGFAFELGKVEEDGGAVSYCLRIYIPVEQEQAAVQPLSASQYASAARTGVAGSWAGSSAASQGPGSLSSSAAARVTQALAASSTAAVPVSPAAATANEPALQAGVRAFTASSLFPALNGR